MSKNELALHWKILIGMVLGVAVGVVATLIDSPTHNANEFVLDWIKPLGSMFVNVLKMIAIPLIVASLIKGVSDLEDLSKLSAMGLRTLGLYLLTTVIAVSLGLLIVNLAAPGLSVPQETRENLVEKFGGQASQRQLTATDQKDRGPLAALEDVIPDNILKAATDNGSMLQVIFFSIFFGVGLILVNDEKSTPVKLFFDGVNEVILKMIDLIMLTAPVGVFSLLAALVVETQDPQLLVALIYYGCCVVVGLALMMLAVYPSAVKLITGVGYRDFFGGMLPAQMLAFSTSSSAATLPVTMERVEEHLGVEKEVSSFVLPIGATINMDGTSLYQAIAAVFIAQVLGFELTVADQITIVTTATLASIGSAAVPGAGMVMLIIVLEAINVPAYGLALIFAVDRPLDMCRTAVNVTGDAAVTMLVAHSVGKLGRPDVRNWDDHYHPPTGDASDNQ
jgi:Na+/H+-dicarboxylate symporter